MLDGANFRD